MASLMVAYNADMMNRDRLNASNVAESCKEDFENSTVIHRARHPLVQSNQKPTLSLHRPKMPVSTAPQSLLASFPNFMSVFKDGTDDRQQRGVDAVATSASSRTSNVGKRPSPSSHFSSPTFRRDSASTFESAESSPTTTISTLDSIITEPSPSSSPESPTSVLPLSSLKPLGTSTRSPRNNMDPSERPLLHPLTALPGVNRADSPNKKIRNSKNLKNLSVNTAASSRQGLSLPKLALSTGPAPSDRHPFSAPPTPSFIVPPKPPRRRPSNLGLTLSTPDTGLNGHDGSTIVPPTPSEPRTRTFNLSHAASNVPIFSPTVAPEGGMCLPPFGNPSIPSRLGKTRPPLSASHHMSLENTNSSPITRQTLDHVQEENDYDLPLSREAKSPAYPDGPVCIYEPFVYLYLEPTESEASEFDVVLNVAREVQNPFSTGTERTGFTHLEDAAVQIPLDSRSSFFAGRRSVSEPQTAISDKSFRASFETQLEDLARQSHETPKAPTTTPEYIHVPWDHNTNVVDDLLRLCEVIDDRVQQQKRVLVHCQCGVSRSASLVVAYGLFKNPRLSVQDAYNVVKDHSRWIGPNMNLIYQLSEFKSNLARRAISGAPSWHPWRGTGSEAFSSNTISVAGSSSLVSLAPFHGSHEEPTSTTHQIDRESQQRANSLGTSKSSHIIDASAGGDVTPGPASAPPDMIWSPSAEDGEPKEDPTAAAIEDHRPDFSAEPKPMEADSNDASQIDQCLPPLTASFEPGIHEAITQPVSSPPQILPAGFSSLSARRNGPHKLSLRQELPMFTSMQIPRGGLDHAMLDDVPQSPSLLSPRAAEFTASPFHRTVAGDLAGSSVFEQALMSPKPQDDDPRSPAQRGEAPITRSIFDML